VPDLIVRNARVYTVDPQQPWAEAFTVSGDRIDAVGSGSELAAEAAATEFDAGGRFVMPGLVDVHNHHAIAGRADLFELTFTADTPLERILAAVRDWSARLGPDEWVVGGSWGSGLVAELSRESSRRALDEAAGGRPVVLGDDSHHNRWASTRALELAGITADSDGPGVVRDPLSGAVSGVLLEDAGLPVEAALSQTRTLSPEQHMAACARGVEMLHAYGVTAFQDAGVSTDILAALARLDQRGELHAWVVTSMLINDPIFGFAPLGRELLGVGRRYASVHHRPDFVKIFLDGVPPTRTAAFLEPYLPDEVHGEHFHGSTLMPQDELTGWLLEAAELGYSAKIHCTGDAAVRAVLDAVAAVRAAGHAELNYQVAHGQFVSNEDIPRFGELGVSADISPFLWWPGIIPNAIADVLPAERAGQMQPNRSLTDTGALVAGGSDWPVSDTPDLWQGIAGLVTRADPTGSFPGTLWSEQALSLEEAIEVFTVNAARAMGLGRLIGSLAPGCAADFVVLNADPFTLAPGELAAVHVEETWFAGRRVYRRPA
jgi:hypothetical protein